MEKEQAIDIINAMLEDIHDLRDRHKTKGMDWELIDEYFEKIKAEINNIIDC